MRESPARRENTSEDVPLLAQPEDDAYSRPQSPLQPKAWQNTQTITHIFMLVILLNSLGDSLLQSPQTRILESVECYLYYEQSDPSKLLLDRSHVGPGAIGGVDEMFCKVGEVQSRLVTLRGWQIFLDCIPSLLFAIPLGWAADRYGRKPFVLAGLGALMLKSAWIQLVTWFWQVFDIRMTWVSALFGSLGGGGAVTLALAFVMFSDITPEAKRSAVFLRAGAFGIVAGLVMPPLAAWLMRYNPWIPAIAGTCLQGLAVTLFSLTPETLNFGARASSIDAARSSTFESFPPPEPDAPLSFQSQSATTTADRCLKQFRTSTAFLLEDWRVPVLIAPFLGHDFLGVCASLVIQYLSARYDITFSDATLVAMIYSATVAVLLFFIIPFVSNTLVNRLHLSVMKKDLYLLRASQILLGAGWCMFSFAPNLASVALSLVLASLGQGAPLLLRSFITSLLPKDQIATAYSFISIVDTLGTMVGAPLLAGLLKRGFSLGGGLVGLPFLATGLVIGGFAVVLFAVRIKKGEDRKDTAAEDER
ncbi:uncharacterized protein LTR77_000517 [Saxophila tyrrhenica]|uniref:Major facilitator superfamily (MFS) profile domain-containing protein n=1 Tax=Saxophila tyrrhenica TaxID=1690608 RepID=A0AAV9PSP0_9PEZI|nr:hypothetical protein LTR77_000517 [Saxophila tyrrhenica]